MADLDFQTGFRELDLCHTFARFKIMRVKVYEIMPGPTGFVLDEQRLHCIIDIEDGNGTFHFLNHSREKLIRQLFSSPSSTFVAGGKSTDGLHFDVIETHPAWSAEAIHAVIEGELYGFNLGAAIENEK